MATNTQTNSILVVGSLAFDTISTPSGSVDRVLGGSANYFSIAASFYAPVKAVGIVGDDFPKSHLKWLSHRNVDVSGIKTVSGKTFHWVGSYNENLNEAKTLSTFLNVFEDFDPILNEAQKNAPYVFLGNIDPTLQLKVLDQVKAPKLIACDSMNFWITGKPEELRKTLKRVDILSLNESEAFLLAGQEGKKKNILEAAEKILTLGPSVLMIKRGEYGALLFSGNTLFLAPAFPVKKVIDPTGAGDCFAGAFMGYLAEAGVTRELVSQNFKKWDTFLRRAVLSGCVMASFAIEDFSLNRLSTLTVPELVERQNKLIQMISI